MEKKINVNLKIPVLLVLQKKKSALEPNFPFLVHKVTYSSTKGVQYNYMASK